MSRRWRFAGIARRVPSFSSPLSRRSPVAGSAALAGAATLSAGLRRTASARPQGEPVVLCWSIWSATQAETEVWQGLADDVQAAQPNITLKLETTSFPDYWDKLQTQLASSTEADVVAMQSLRMPSFSAREACAPSSR